MTRAYLGLAALDALFLVAGLGLLAGLGYVRSARAALRLAGLAFTLGWAVAGVAFVLALVLGLSLAVWQVAVLGLALAAAGLAAARLTPAVDEPEPSARRGGRTLALLAGAALVVYLEELGRRALVATASYHQDAWGFWLPKAKAIVLFDGLHTGPGGVTSYAHSDYPPLLPALDAAAFRFADSLDASLLPLQEWVVAVGFLAALAGLLAPRVPASVLWPSLALVALTPAFSRPLVLSLADAPLAMLFALAGVAVALWLADSQPGHAVLASLLLAAAALTKSEGRLLAIVLAAVTALAVARELKARWLPLLTLLLVPLAATLPWRLWLRANEVTIAPDYRLSRLLEPGTLADRGDRLGTALAELPGYLAGGGGWFLLLPLALAAAALAAARAPALAILSIGTTLAVLLGLAAVYWIGDLPVEAYIDTSAERAVGSPILFAASLLPLALAALLGPARDDPG